MIVLDVESSGTNPDQHSILSIGALDLDEPTNQFYDECRIWGGAKIEKEACEINGFSEEDAKDSEKKTEAELIAAFFAWATDRPKDRTLAAQNVAFDRAFLEAAARRAHIECPFAHRTLDLHSLTWLHMTLHGKEVPQIRNHSAINSKTVLEYCGLPEETHPHNALTGALWHAEVIARMAYNKNVIPDFSSFPIPWQTKS
ncbi:MAG TPA: 3'-5' exonuclease [Candidatus Paceibacterota bacterium]|nr:3'-5' exonuclease [Candidatus Paceibacterota bacterium]